MKHPLPRFRKHQLVRLAHEVKGSIWNVGLNLTGYVSDVTRWRPEWTGSDQTYPAGYYYAIDEIGAWIWEGQLENADMRVHTDG